MRKVLGSIPSSSRFHIFCRSSRHGSVFAGYDQASGLTLVFLIVLHSDTG